MIPRSLAYVHARPCHFREESAQLGHVRNCAEYLSLVALLLRCEPGVVLRASFLFSYFLSLVMFGILVAGAFRCWILSWRASFLGTLSARVLGTVLWCLQVASPPCGLSGDPLHQRTDVGKIGRDVSMDHSQVAWAAFLDTIYLHIKVRLLVFVHVHTWGCLRLLLFI